LSVHNRRPTVLGLVKLHLPGCGVARLGGLHARFFHAFLVSNNNAEFGCCRENALCSVPGTLSSIIYHVVKSVKVTLIAYATQMPL